MAKINRYIIHSVTCAFFESVSSYKGAVVAFGGQRKRSSIFAQSHAWFTSGKNVRHISMN